MTKYQEHFIHATSFIEKLLKIKMVTLLLGHPVYEWGGVRGLHPHVRTENHGKLPPSPFSERMHPPVQNWIIVANIIFLVIFLCKSLHCISDIFTYIIKTSLLKCKIIVRYV